MLEKLPSKIDLVESVKTAILEAILSGKINPNEKLSQTKIANELGVSRQPVIQAFRILSEQGILVPHGKKGLTVTALDQKGFCKLLAVRKELDCLGVRLAAQRVTAGGLIDEDHEIIEAINKLISDSNLLIVNGEHLKLVRNDISFHELLRALSGNEFIQLVLEAHLLHYNRLVSAMSVNLHEKIWDQHQRILDAILKGNEELAEQLTLEHLEHLEHNEELAGPLTSEHNDTAVAAIGWNHDANG